MSVDSGTLRRDEKKREKTWPSVATREQCEAMEPVNEKRFDQTKQKNSGKEKEQNNEIRVPILMGRMIQLASQTLKVGGQKIANQRKGSESKEKKSRFRVNDGTILTIQTPGDCLRRINCIADGMFGHGLWNNERKERGGKDPWNIVDFHIWPKGWASIRVNTEDEALVISWTERGRESCNVVVTSIKLIEAMGVGNRRKTRILLPQRGTLEKVREKQKNKILV